MDQIINFVLETDVKLFVNNALSEIVSLDTEFLEEMESAVSAIMELKLVMNTNQKQLTVLKVIY